MIMEKKNGDSLLKDYLYISKYFVNQRQKYVDLKNKQQSTIKSLNIDGKILNGLSFDSKIDLTSFLSNLKLSNPASFEEHVKKAKELHPDLFTEDYNALEREIRLEAIKYFSVFYLYLVIMNEYFECVFDKKYKERLLNLANNGYFLFFIDLPIFKNQFTDNIEDNINIVKNYFLNDEMSNLFNEIKVFTENKNPKNELEQIKSSELMEVLKCLKSESYSSCCRTLFALIENDHTNASNINANLFRKKITKGEDRAKKITDQINSIDLSYLKKWWKIMNEFYHDLTCSSNKNNKDYINRNDLVHGEYERSKMPNKEWCLKLFLFYLSFKRISFILQSLFDIKTEIVDILVAQKTSNLSN